MPYADQLLADGESIVRREHQHWIFPFYLAGRWVALAALVTVIGFVLAQFVFKSDGTGIIAGAIGLINNLITIVTVVALAIAVVGFIWAVVMWKTQEYVLTTHRVLHVHGVINKQGSDSSLENITDAQITIPWLGRMLGFGDLKVMTASEAGINQLRALRDPIGFKKSMMTAKTEHVITLNTPRQAGVPTTFAPVPSPAVAAAPAVASAPPPPAVPAAPAAAAASSLDETTVVPPLAQPAQPAQSAEDVTETLARLAQLRDSGAITPEEYDVKKQELLDRI